MKVIHFNEEYLRERVNKIQPKYLFMNPQTLAFIEADWNGPFRNLPDGFGFTSSFPGVKVETVSRIPFGEIIFGVE